MKYTGNIDGVFTLNITEQNLAVVKGDTDQEEVTVQLESDDEATKMVAEFEDPEGELMNAEDSIFGKYPQLHQFRP